MGKVNLYPKTPAPKIKNAAYPAKWTRGDQLKIARWLSTLTLAALRKRQTINEVQMQRAYEQKNRAAVDTLYVMSNVLTAAVMIREFGEE